MSNEGVVEFIRERFAKAATDSEKKGAPPVDPKEICEELISRCLSADPFFYAGCDNMTVVLVCFLHGKPYSQMLLR